MSQFLVEWKIDIGADNPVEAARQALMIMRDNDPANTATFFEVTDENGDVTRVDLDDG